MCSSVEIPDLVLQKASYSQSLTHSRPAECGSRQTIQARPDHSNRIVSPPRGLPRQYATGGTKLRSFCYKVQQQTDPICVTSNRPPGLGSRCLSWEDLDPYALVAILVQVVKKLQDYPCRRIIQIAPGWPDMPWFWDLVAISSQIPLCLPSLLTRPFNQTPHRNLSNLNLHAWLIEPQQSRSMAFRQWQDELRLLKEIKPDQSMMQSGPFLQSGASVIRWTSGHPMSSQ